MGRCKKDGNGKILSFLELRIVKVGDVAILLLTSITFPFQGYFYVQGTGILEKPSSLLYAITHQFLPVSSPHGPVLSPHTPRSVFEETRISLNSSQYILLTGVFSYLLSCCQIIILSFQTMVELQVDYICLRESILKLLNGCF